MEAKHRSLHPLSGIIGLFSGMVLLCYAFRVLFVEMLTLRDFLLCFAAAALGAVGTLWPAAAAAPDRPAREAIVRKGILILFVFYLACLMGMLFTARVDGTFSLAQRREIYLAHRETYLNLTPFKTVRRYLLALSRGVIPDISLRNLIGNVILLVPMAVLAPCLFPGLRRFWRFSLVSLALLLAIEGLQLMLCVGICDVDDVILNFAGGMLTWLLLRLPPVQRGLRALCLLPEAAN